MRLAEEQSVIGLVTAGLEHVTDVKIPQEWLLQFIGQTIQLEQCNKEMNSFIVELMDELRNTGINTLLVKGQGIAQCYEKPLWRASGDVDLIVDADNYKKANLFLHNNGKLLSRETEKNKKRLNAEYEVGDWIVELHGTQHANLSKRMDSVLDLIQDEVLTKGKVRVWQNGKADVYLPAATEDVLFVFAHILQHLFLGGIGLRQVCDWCRLLWTYRDTIDRNALESYICQMGVMTEWKVFAHIAVDTLGMPVKAMLLYDETDNQNEKLKRKAKRLLSYILEVGNFGHYKDNSYIKEYSGLKRKVITLWRQTQDSARLSMIFPIDAPKFLSRFFWMA